MGSNIPCSSISTNTATTARKKSLFPQTQLAGFLPAPIFLKPDGTVFQKAYTAAFPLAIVEGKATSRAGVFSDTCSLNAAMEKARTLGTDYTVGTTAEWYTECLYMWVEFATRNMQSVMNGASSLSYVASDTATVAETAVNRIIVASTVAAKYVVGQTILIGTSLGSSNIANNRIVTAIEDYDAENKAIVFDGEPVNIAVGNIVCTAAWINGSCNDVLSSSGSPCQIQAVNTIAYIEEKKRHTETLTNGFRTSFLADRELERQKSHTHTMCISYRTRRNIREERLRKIISS